MSKVLASLNNPEVVTNEEIRQRNIEHLNKLDQTNIRTSFRKSLQPGETAIEERFTRLLAEYIGESENRIMNVIEENLANRVARIEENERLSSRVLTHKKDEILPLVRYSRRPADPDTYKKALNQLNSRIKVIEKSLTYVQDAFNFAHAVAAESNNVARDFELSMDQQRMLILSYLPGNEFVYRFLSMHEKLPDMLKTISLYATNVVTRNELEKQLNAWVLVNTSETEMYMSIIKLIDMLNRIREDYGLNPPNIPELFRSAVTWIQRQTNIPRHVRDHLYEARLRIRPDDSMTEANAILVAACSRWLGSKPIKPQVKAITSDMERLAIEHFPQPKKGKKAQVLAITGPEVKDSKPATQPAPKNQNSGQKSGKQDGKKADDGKGKGQGKGQDGKKKFVKPSFVKPWPENSPYVGKNGNNLTKEFENWFKNHCHRCGHSSHLAEKCRTYTDKSTILTLCSRCRQGLHDNCKSKRPDLQQAAMLKEVKKMYANMYSVPPPVAPAYMWHYGVPPPPVAPAVTQAPSDSDSE
jgi:hypothetical protein